jgi:hypothetical protein
MKKKAAVELSVNFLVMLILAIVVFGFSIKFIYDIYGQAVKVQDMSQQDFDRRIQDLQCDGAKMCILKPLLILKPNDAVTNGVKIINILPDEKDFTIKVTQKGAFAKDKTPMNVKLPISLPDSTFTLKRNDVTKKGFAIDWADDAKVGTYIFQIEILYNEENTWSTYDKTQFTVAIQ